MGNNLTMDNKEKQIKRKIIEFYFKELNDIDLLNTRFRILYKDVNFFKNIGLPKRLFRKYFLELKQKNIYHKIPISYKQKIELKEIILKLSK